VAYAFVQQNAADNAASATTITVTLTPTAGNLLVFCVSGDSLDTTSIALSDNLGTHNTFTQIGTDLVTAVDQRCAWWFAANCKGGATTFTATFSAATRFRTIYVAEYSGIATTNPFLNGARAENDNPGTGTDAVSSGNANATSQPALVWGFCIDVNGSTTPTAGTGFTSRTGVWSTATCLGRPEDKRVTTTGNVAATFTATTGTDAHGTGIGIFAEAVATPTVASWTPDFPDRFPARPSVSALGVAVAPVLAIAVPLLSWSPSFPDRAPARPVPNLATGAAVEPVFVPPAAPAVTPMSWAPDFPDQLARTRAVPIVGGSSAPEATLPNPVPSLTTWLPGYPDAIPRARAPLITGGMVEPIAPNPVPSLASWTADYTDSITRARALPVPSGAVAPTLPLPNAPPSIFPLTISSNGRHLRKNDGTPFLLCADTTWSLFVDIPLANLSSYFSTLVSQGINAVMGNVIEHHYTTVKPPKERGGLLPFTQRMDGTSYTGSPNGTTGAAGTQGQFASDNYSNINNQSPDPTFINNSYWLVVEQILDAALASNLAVLVWPGYLGFHVNDEGWLNEMTVWDAVTGAGGFTGQSFADNTKSKMWNYGAWLAARWKNYPHIIWVMGGDYGSNTQTLNTAQASAVSNLMAGLKSVAGQKSLLFSAHWDRPALSTDTSLAAGSFDLNGCYADESVAELARRGYASSPTKPTIGLEYFYEGDLFGGSAPYRKYVYWQFLGGIAGGFYGNEQLWRFDNGSPGTDWTTLLATQARLDAVRQFAFWQARPWWRLVPSGLGGMGTIVTAGGGTASPQSTDYVAAAATPEGDLLLAYVPPAHTGSVTIDMTKLGASVTARWFDPANATFTAIGTFANTGTHAFTTPGNNSAGDADWLLVLEAPNAPMPLSWDPSFPDRCLRSSLTLAQVVSGVVEPVAPPPPPTVANWAPDFPDSASRARQPVNVGGTFKPEATLPDPVPLSWAPSFLDRLPSPAGRQPGGPTAPPTDTNAGPLTWLSGFPDRASGPGRTPAGGTFAPPSDTNAGPLVWLPGFPDRAPGPGRAPAGGTFAPPSDTSAAPLVWLPNFPDRAPGPGRSPASEAVAPPTDTNAGPLTWLPRMPDLPGRSRFQPPESAFAPLLVVAPVVLLSWSPGFPDLALRARQPIIPGGATQPEATLPNAPAVPLSWSPGFPDLVLRARQPIVVGGATQPEATLANAPAFPLSWSPSFPSFVPRVRQPIVVGGATQPEATLPNPATPFWNPSFPDRTSPPLSRIHAGGPTTPPTDTNAGPLTWLPQTQGLISGPRVPPRGGEFAPPPVIVPPLSWVPVFPSTALHSRRSTDVGGMTKPEATIPDQPAPSLSWFPDFPDSAPKARHPINTGGPFAPEATLPNPPAPPLSWAPAFPAFASRALQPVNAGGMVGPEATIPNPPAPPLSWAPEFPDFAPHPSPPIGTGGMAGPVASSLIPPKTTPPGRAPTQLVGHVATQFVEPRQNEDAHLHGMVRRKRDV
jgi:hypothetical protein